MPRQLDKRVIGLDLADVATESYTGLEPTSPLEVSIDGNHMVAGNPRRHGALSQEAIAERTGLTLQQLVTSGTQSITPTTLNSNNQPVNVFASIWGSKYGTGQFITVGEDYNGNGMIQTLFVLSKTYGTSGYTGNTPVWTQMLPTTANTNFPILRAIEYGNGIWIAVGDSGTIWTLNTAGTWDNTATLTPPSINSDVLMYRFSSISYGESKGWVVAGDLYDTTTSTVIGGVTYHSGNGVNWTLVVNGSAMGSNIPVSQVAFGDGKWVAVGGGAQGTGGTHIAVSQDGLTWAPGVSSQPVAAHNCVTYGNGIWIIGTNNSSNGNSFLYSYDLVSWNTLPSATPGSYPVGTSISSACYGNGMFVLGGGNTYISSDGLNYGIVIGGLTNPTSISYGNGIFLFTDDTGNVSRTLLLDEFLKSYVTNVTGGSGGSNNISGIYAQLFTSSGTFTIPAGVTAIKVTLVGAGGGGWYSLYGRPGCCCGPYVGVNGGNGAAAIKWLSSLTPLDTITVVVGTGGTAFNGTTNNGTAGNGGASSISSGTQTITTVTANGGYGATWGAPGINGTSSGGDLNNATLPGDVYGSRGLAGISSPSTPATNGQPGIVIFEW
jgi:hypothetical protein